MTETKLDIEFLGGCYPTLENHVLTDLLQQGLKDVAGPVWTKEELDFADKLNRDNAGYEALKNDPDYDGPLSAHVSPIFTGYIYGSTDVGDVQHICPCSELNTASWNAAAPGHSWQITSCAGMSIGEKGMMYGARVLGLTAARAAADPKVIEAAKAEFEKSMAGKSYHCPIPAEVPVPMPEKK